MKHTFKYINKFYNIHYINIFIELIYKIWLYDQVNVNVEKYYVN